MICQQIAMWSTIYAVESYNKVLFNDCLCLTAINKQQIYMRRLKSQTSTGQQGKMANKWLPICLKDSPANTFSGLETINHENNVV